MRYIRTFESSGEEMDLEIFKEIMLDVTDMAHHFIYDDMSNELNGDKYYSCMLDLAINILSGPQGSLYSGMDLIEGSSVPSAEDPEDIKTAKEVIKDRVSEIEDDLYDIKNKIDSIIETNRKVLVIINYIDKYITPRFESFLNYKNCMVGIDYQDDSIRITVTFEIN